MLKVLARFACLPYFSVEKIGGLTFVKIGQYTFSYSKSASPKEKMTRERARRVQKRLNQISKKYDVEAARWRA